VHTASGPAGRANKLLLIFNWPRVSLMPGVTS